MQENCAVHITNEILNGNLKGSEIHIWIFETATDATCLRFF